MLHRLLKNSSGITIINKVVKRITRFRTLLRYSKETGVSAQEYIQTKVIEVAKKRLFDVDKSISEIAYELGFRYPQHFTRLFKQRTGLTPNEYRTVN
ncbi:HTH-type transcriptional activator RhaS [bioreactor metagenome]|uniref:HTH-type transcriptional activator RhaS n=1 Tax=bioreactor metagenome TaxID=1076179 RepID=A0A645HIK9_9ZZZZ|nr:MAG: hypothetical protein BGO33_09275 [Bacteroidia bacterium 43-41]